MKLTVLENIWGEKVEIGYRGRFFTRDVIAIILIFVFVVVETPIILLLLKKLASSDLNFLFFSIVLIVLLLGVFILVFLTSPPKLLSFKASKAKGEIELIWRKNIILKSQQVIANHLIGKILISVIDTKPQNIVKMEIEKLDGEKISFRCPLESSDFHEGLYKVLLNLAAIIGFKSYTAKRGLSSYKVLFTKTLEGKFHIDDFQREIKFEEEDYRDKIRDIKIPDLTIKELSDTKISLYKKPNFYDILRLLFVFLIFPALFIFAYMAKNPGSFSPVVVVIAVYGFIVYLVRRLISPMETTIDKLRGIVRVKKLFLSSSFPIGQIYQIELSDQLSRRTGTFIFNIDARLKNGRAHQLFYTEFSDKEEKKHEVFENIMHLLKIIKSNLDIEIKDKTKHL